MTFVHKTLRSAFVQGLLLAVVPACLVLSGCEEPEDPNTIRFISWQKGEAGVGDWWEAIIQEFETTHPGVTIEFTKVERAAFAATMTTLFAAGDPPDIVHLASFEYPLFAENGWLEDLNPWLKRENVNISNWPGQDVCVWNSSTYCINLQYFGFVMGYNKTLLAENNLSIPTSWEEFLVAARTLTQDLNGDRIIDQFGVGHETRGGGGQYLTEMLNYLLDSGAFWTDRDGEITINTPAMVEGLRRWKLVVTENLTPRDYTSSDIRQLFSDGKIGMVFDGPWLLPALDAGVARGQLAVAPSPFSRPVGGSSSILAMTSETSAEHKTLIWDFIQLATSPAFQSLFATLAHAPPSSPDVPMSDGKRDDPNFMLLVQAQQLAASQGTDRIPRGLELQYGEFANMIKDEAQKMIVNDRDPSDVAADMHKRAVAIQRSR